MHPRDAMKNIEVDAQTWFLSMSNDGRERVMEWLRDHQPSSQWQQRPIAWALWTLRINESDSELSATKSDNCPCEDCQTHPEMT